MVVRDGVLTVREVFLRNPFIMGGITAFESYQIFEGRRTRPLSMGQPSWFPDEFVHHYFLDFLFEAAINDVGVWRTRLAPVLRRVVTAEEINVEYVVNLKARRKPETIRDGSALGND